MQPLSESSVLEAETLPALDVEQCLDPPESALHPAEPALPRSTATPEPTSSSTLHFYFPRPVVPSSQPTVSPLAPKITLAEALQGRIVLEFPRIYAFRHKPEETPVGVSIEKEVKYKEVRDHAGKDNNIDKQKEDALGNDLKGQIIQPEGTHERAGANLMAKEDGDLTALEALRLRVLRSMMR